METSFPLLKTCVYPFDVAVHYIRQLNLVFIGTSVDEALTSRWRTAFILYTEGWWGGCPCWSVYWGTISMQSV